MFYLCSLSKCKISICLDYFKALVFGLATVETCKTIVVFISALKTTNLKISLFPDSNNSEKTTKKEPTVKTEIAGFFFVCVCVWGGVVFHLFQREKKEVYLVQKINHDLAAQRQGITLGEKDL